MRRACSRCYGPSANTENGRDAVWLSVIAESSWPLASGTLRMAFRCPPLMQDDPRGSLILSVSHKLIILLN